MKYIITAILSFFILYPGSSQTLTSIPALPTADSAVVIHFDATGTPLESYTEVVYAHTGVLKNGSNVWSDVIGSWGNNDEQPALTSLGNHKYILGIQPTIREFYGVGEQDHIDKMAFVFRSADGNTQTVDLFLDVYEAGLNVSITSPAGKPYFADPGEDIPVDASASNADSMFLYLDGLLLQAVEGNSISQTLVAANQPDSRSWIKVIASNEDEEVADSTYYYVRGETVVESLPEGLRDGINYTDDSTAVLVLLAPYKTSVYVQGDFNDWQIGPQYKLKRTTLSASDPWARYWLAIEGLVPGQEYAFQYIIDESLFIAEPYSAKVLDPAADPDIPESVYPGLKEYPQGKATGIVSVLQTGQEDYPWQVDDFTAPETTDLVIYEMLVRDFTAAHSYAAVADTLDYLSSLGVNALELMPVNEFEFNSSWGYNPSFYFAADKYYGPSEQLKRLIDECHKRGIAVILDIVLNHSYYQSPLVQMYFAGNKPAAENPWYNEEHNFENEDAHWGYDFDHTSPYTRAFIDSVNSYWMSEYRIDGFRFDFTKGFSNTWHGSDDPWGSKYDGARIFHLTRMANEIWDRNEDAIIIMEHLAENSEEKVLSDHGILLWGNHNYNYAEAAMGYHDGGKSDFSGMSYQQRNWNDPHLVGYMESHDEERVMYKVRTWGNAAQGHDTKQLETALARIRLASTFFYTIPGPKMLWQFGELGYDYSIDYNGRLGEKPVRWDYFDDWRRNYNYRFLSSLIKLRKEHDVFETEDFDLNVSGPLKSITLDGADMDVMVVGNFDVRQGDIAVDFTHTGSWYEYFTGEEIEVDDTYQLISLQAGEYRLYTDIQLETPAIGTSAGELYPPPEPDFKIFPNPVRDNASLFVNLPESSSVDIRIYNTSGARLKDFSKDISASGEQLINMDLSMLDPGIYFCNIRSGNINDTIKFIKQ